MTEIVHAEWLKVRTVRSTWWILLALALFVGFSAWISWYGATTPGGIPSEARDAFALDVQARFTTDVAGLCFAVLAVLAFTAEHTTGMIHTTFGAVPRRRRVLASKALVVATIAAVVGQISVLATYFATRAILDARPGPGQSVATFSDDVPALLAFGLSVVMYALIGLGLATITRSTAASIVAFVGLWYLVPMVAGSLPAPWDERLGSLPPGALAGQLAGTGNDYSVYGASLSPPAAAAAIVAWVAIPLGIAAILISRRDA